MSGSSSHMANQFAARQIASFPPQPMSQFQPPPGTQQQTGQTTSAPPTASVTGLSGGATSGLSFPTMDLSGKLIIKVQIEGDEDIRRIPIHNEDITYDELLLMMQRVFVGKVSSSDDVVVKYRDEDGDFITIMDHSDLTVAKQACRILHLKLYIQGRTFPHISGCSCDVKSVRQELIEVRDKVTRLLDLLVPDAAPLQQAAVPESRHTVPESSRQVDTAGLSVAQQLFDPLKSQATSADRASSPVAETTMPIAMGASGGSTVSVIADSFGLSSEDVQPAPEQPNAPPSDAVAASFTPVKGGQQQQPMHQVQPAFQPAATAAAQPLPVSHIPQQPTRHQPLQQQPPQQDAVASAFAPTSAGYPGPASGSGANSSTSTPANSYFNSTSYAPAATSAPPATGTSNYYSQAPPTSSVAQPQPTSQQPYGGVSYPPASQPFRYPAQGPQNPAGSAPPPANQYAKASPGAPPAAGGPPAANPYAQQGVAGYGAYPGGYTQPGYR